MKNKKKKYKSHRSISTIEDSIRFIKENNITTRVELNKKFPGYYKNKFLKYTNEIQDLILPSTRKQNIVTSYDDLKKFIKDNNIISRSDFGNRFSKYYLLGFLKLSIEQQDSLLPIKKKELASFDKLKDIISENNIMNRTQLSEFSYYYYNSFCKLPKKLREELLPKRSNTIDREKIFKNLESFVKENKIKTKSDLKDNYISQYKDFLRLSKEQKELLFPTLLEKSLGESLEESFNFVKDFIRNNNIKTRTEFQNKSSSIYFNYFCKLPDSSKDLLLPSKHKLCNNKSLESIIKDNNITTRMELCKKFPGYYKNIFCNLSTKEKDRILPKENKTKYSELTFSDFEKYIKDNNITSRLEFYKFNSTYYSKFAKKLTEEEKELLLPAECKLEYKQETFSDFEKFIKENNISNRKELYRKYRQLYYKFLKKLTDEEKELLLPVLNLEYPQKTYEDFKKFIKENNIKSKKEFSKRFAKCYEKFRRYLTKEERDTLLSPIISRGEVFLADFFKEKGINFEKEKTYNDLVSEKLLRFDFYLPEIGVSGLLIEYHGRQHFKEGDLYYTKKGIEHDKLKYEYAKQNNIPILYFTNEVEIYKKYGYFTEVITDVNILIQRIKEIGLTSQSNS